MDGVGRVRRGGVNEAEDSSRTLVDPVFQVVNVVGALGLQVRLVRLRDVIDADTPGDLVNIHVQRHDALLLTHLRTKCGPSGMRMRGGINGAG